MRKIRRKNNNTKILIDLSFVCNIGILLLEIIKIMGICMSYISIVFLPNSILIILLVLQILMLLKSLERSI